jgi:hypothetical protein
MARTLPLWRLESEVYGTILVYILRRHARPTGFGPWSPLRRSSVGATAHSKLCIPVGVAVALRGLAVALQTVTRSRVRNLRKPSAAVRRDGPGGDGESEGARERVAPSSSTLLRRVPLALFGSHETVRWSRIRTIGSA